MLEQGCCGQAARANRAELSDWTAVAGHGQAFTRHDTIHDLAAVVAQISDGHCVHDGHRITGESGRPEHPTQPELAPPDGSRGARPTFVRFPREWARNRIEVARVDVDAEIAEIARDAGVDPAQVKAEYEKLVEAGRAREARLVGEV
jgi:hypothetical protein